MPLESVADFEIVSGPAELTRQAADSGIDHALGYWDDPDFAGC